MPSGPAFREAVLRRMFVVSGARPPPIRTRKMKAKFAGLVIAIAAMAPAYAASSDITKLAEFTGLSERKVQMILGCHSCYAEYRYTYHRSLEKFKRALGDDNFERLMAGQPVTLDNGLEVRVASVD